MPFQSYKLYYAYILISFLFHLNAEVVPITYDNFKTVIGETELVFINFYADWCRFSQMLAPIFDEAEVAIKNEISAPGKVALAKVDCEREGILCQEQRMSKYPTMRLFRNGVPVKREYRGQRSVEAFMAYIKDQLVSTVDTVQNLESLDSLDWQKRHIIGYYEQVESEDYKTFEKVAAVLRNDCVFHSVIGSISEKERVAGNKIVFRPAIENYNEMVYSGPLNDYNLLFSWTSDKCVPLVRELTFENAEEFTEEGMPFLMLFHNPADIDTPERFRKLVANDLLDQRTSINFLTANGLKFTHPLNHLGKSAEDLPVVAIDSFKHMFVWNKDVKSQIDQPGLIRQFIEDLKSGKLHREFHQGPDPTQPPQTELPKIADSPASEPHIPKDKNEEGEDAGVQYVPTSPPESLFKKLAPSRTRYSILKDEL